MVFSSLVFLFIFFPVTLFFYFIVKNDKAKNIVLIIASLIFYSWGEPVWVCLLIFSSILDYTVSLGIEKYRGKKITKLFIALSVVINLGLLVAFKYSGFFISTLNGIFRLSLHVPAFSLPIGISFYTFQTMSYSLDVYKGDVKAQKSFINFLMFVSLFPQLIAGPIVRYSDIDTQIDHRTVTIDGFAKGMTRFMAGLGKKVLIANTLAYTADKVFALDGAAINAPIAWLGAVCYLMQIYFDFSGYSDMAIGLGRAFGFTFRENFMYPYCAASMQDFWRKWHISLSTWFKEYVYIPLGGNRRGKLRTGLNKLIVFLLTGLWHGASWNFAVWGLYHGAFLMAESYGALKPNRWPKALRHIYTVIAVTVGFVIFRAETLGQAWLIISKMFGGWTFDAALGAQLSLLLSPLCSAALIASVFACMPYASSIASRYTVNRPRFGYAVYLAAFALFVVCIACLSTASYNPFIYFRF